MPTTRRDSIRLPMVERRRVENAHDANRFHPSSCGSTEEKRRMPTTRTGFIRFRVVERKREKNTDDANSSHPSSCSRTKKSGECQRCEQAPFVFVWWNEGERRMPTTRTGSIRLRVVERRREKNADDVKRLHPSSCGRTKKREEYRRREQVSFVFVWVD